MQTSHDMRCAVDQVRRTLSLPAMLLAVLVACADVTSPDLSAIVRVEADTIQAQHYQAGSVAWLRFVVPVSIQNTSSASVFIHECSYGVEQLVDSQWRDVWNPICSLGTGLGTEVRPNEQRSLAVRVDAATAGPGAPEWKGVAIAGTYRLTVVLFSGGSDVTSVTKNSDTFLLASETVP